jgi:hypothetical protein
LPQRREGAKKSIDYSTEKNPCVLCAVHGCTNVAKRMRPPWMAEGRTTHGAVAGMREGGRLCDETFSFRVPLKEKNHHFSTQEEKTRAPHHQLDTLAGRPAA